MKNAKNPKRIILFRFHDHFDICANRIQLIKKFNPDIEIYGLYGGTVKNWPKAKKLPLKNIWNIPIDDPFWKWLNGDLVVRWWYKEIGKKIKFDMVHLFEWDMLLLENVNTFFSHITEGVALTYLRPLSLQGIDEWHWTAPQRGRKEWNRLLDSVKKQFSYDKKPLVGIFGGAAMSRSFLEHYSKYEIPSWCNDECRLPLYAQAFNMPVINTKLGNTFVSTDDSKQVSPSTIYKEYKKGIKSFHPVREKINLKLLKS